MAKVIQGKRLADDEEPEEHIAAEGKRVLKDMVAQQLDTSLTLESQEKRARTFVSGAPLADFSTPSGAITPESFGALKERDEIRLKLLGAGVEPGDVDKIFTNETGKLSEPERLARQQLWNEAAQKLLDAENQADQLPSTSRRRLEEELRACVPATGVYARFLQTQRKQLPPTAHLPSDDALTKELLKTEKDLFSHLHSASAPSATGRKRRRDRKVVDSLALDSKTNDVTQSLNFRESLWDVKTVSHEHRLPACQPSSVSNSISVPKSSSKKSNVIGCSQQRLFTIKDGAIVELKGKKATEVQSNVILSPQEIKSNRMTIDEIVALPKFSNYQKGTPNKVLFVKNIPPRLTEAELLTIFSDYSPTECRIMTGRMKGQAFVTFNDEETALSALDGVIGTVVENKPIVIQFGRTDSSDKTVSPQVA